MTPTEYLESLWRAKKLIIGCSSVVGLSASVLPGIQLGLITVLSLLIHAVYWNRSTLQARDKIALIGLMISIAMFIITNSTISTWSADMLLLLHFGGVVAGFLIALLAAAVKPLW
jgi:hypothetical protein